VRSRGCQLPRFVKMSSSGPSVPETSHEDTDNLGGKHQQTYRRHYASDRMVSWAGGFGT